MRFLAAITILILSVVAFPSFAGGPLEVDTLNNTGAPMRWTNDRIEWYLDDGPLSSVVANAEAKPWVEEAMGKWMKIKLDDASGNSLTTSVLTATSKGSGGVNINGSNWQNYLANDSELRTFVVFDEDGTITADVMGDQNTGNVVGFSMLLLSDSTGLRIRKGFTVFNGKVLSENSLAPNLDTAKALFKASILHELGHLINLDHSQVNYDIAKSCVRNVPCDGSNYIPTMYPELLAASQSILSRDEKVTASWIYPTSDFEKNFCTITGEIFDAAGHPLKGVNVVAMRAGEGDVSSEVDVRAFVSGVLKTGCLGDSRYYLHGIVPGHKYQVIYEPIGSEFSGSSDFEPLPTPPGGFERGDVLSTSGESTVECSAGGETIEMASVVIDTTNPCTSATLASGETTEETGKAQQSKCSMVPGGKRQMIDIVYLLAAAAAIWVARLRKESEAR